MQFNTNCDKMHAKAVGKLQTINNTRIVNELSTNIHIHMIFPQ